MSKYSPNFNTRTKRFFFPPYNCQTCSYRKSSAHNSVYHSPSVQNYWCSISLQKLISAASSWKAKLLKRWNNLMCARENSSIMSGGGGGGSIRCSCSLQCSCRCVRCSHRHRVVNGLPKASVHHFGAEIFNPAVIFIFS